ncbi:MAG: transporter permease, partial [Firmicutes bacterium]|nr:transporter permease [Bacillota bacterium]
MRWPTLLRDVKQHTNAWMLVSLLGAAVILLPLALIPLSLFHAPNENWAHIKQYLLKGYLLNSLWLVLWTGVGTVITATGLAWLVAAHDFPLRGFFRWALLLPLTVPPYIAAYTYADMFSYTGIVQKSLRSAFGITPAPKWFGIMSLRGAIFIFTLFLFPYLYLIIRSFVERQSAAYVENARVLGRGPWAIFFHVILPLARPAIVAGLTLVAFEVLSDYGVTSYYGVATISTAIFQTWFGMYDVESAIRLAALLMVGVVSLLLVERIVRGNRRYSSSTTQSRPYVLRPLRGIHAVGAVLVCGVIFAFSFLIPFLQLLVWATWTYADVLNAAFGQMLFRTLYLALVATAVIMLLATIVANVHRTSDNALSYALSRSVTACFSVPGA